MKPQALIQKGIFLPFLMTIFSMLICFITTAQVPQQLYVVITFQKVENRAEFEKIMIESWKPMQQLRKQNGKILNWAVYRVHFKGANDEYNYASAVYYASFAKTEPNDNYAELLKAANPNEDAQATLAKVRSLRTNVRQSIYSRVDFVTSKTPIPIKYIEVDFMKTKPGLASEYEKLEREDWKPVHQSMVDAGQRIGWTFWSQVVPGGTGGDHDYFTSNVFSSYEQISGADYEAAFKKAHPGKDPQAVFDKTSKTRDLVKRELLEFVVGLN
jgi:hypothetical protein